MRSNDVNLVNKPVIQASDVTPIVCVPVGRNSLRNNTRVSPEDTSCDRAQNVDGFIMILTAEVYVLNKFELFNFIIMLFLSVPACPLQ